MRARKLLALTSSFVFCLSLATAASADNPRTAAADTTVQKVPASVVDELRVVGTAVFDNGVPFRRDGDLNGTVGNRFAEAPPAATSHTIATVSFAMAGNYGTSIIFSAWDVNAASANLLARQIITGVPQSPGNTIFSAAVNPPVVGHTGSFVAGLRNTAYVPCSGDTSLGSTCDGVALTQGSSPEPPFDSRAARVNFTDTAFPPTVTVVGSAPVDIPGVNAIFRVTGDNLPVELLSFDVD